MREGRAPHSGRAGPLALERVGKERESDWSGSKARHAWANLKLLLGGRSAHRCHWTASTVPVMLGSGKVCARKVSAPVPRHLVMGCFCVHLSSTDNIVVFLD